MEISLRGLLDLYTAIQICVTVLFDLKPPLIVGQPFQQSPGDRQQPLGAKLSLSLAYLKQGLSQWAALEAVQELPDIHLLATSGRRPASGMISTTIAQ